MSENNVYFVSGGGTGGHIYPAVTVIENLLNDEDTSKIYFIGNPENLEFEIIKKYPQVEFLPVNVTGMPRKISFAFIKWGIQLFFAFIKASGYIKKYKPNAIFTTGGYVSAPVILAAMSRKTPYMIHDCDSIPGLVSKMAAPKAKIVSVAFENSMKFLKSKNIKFNGNPIRDVFYTVSRQEARGKLNIDAQKRVIFAMGGSQGAKTINSAMIKLLKNLAENKDNFVILQTGKNKYNEVCEELEKIYPAYKDNENILLRPYFDEMVYPLKASDIVIARAGSLSLSEIIQCGLASVLVPYPFAAQDHQRKNAREMCDKGVALYLEDSDCNEINLLNILMSLINDGNKLAQMREKAQKSAKNNPAKEIVKQLKSIIQ